MGYREYFEYEDSIRSDFEEDAYWNSLEEFYYKEAKIDDRDWEELTISEIDSIKELYKKAEEEEQRWIDEARWVEPRNVYMTWSYGRV